MLNDGALIEPHFDPSGIRVLKTSVSERAGDHGPVAILPKTQDFVVLFRNNPFQRTCIDAKDGRRREHVSERNIGLPRGPFLGDPLAFGPVDYVIHHHLVVWGEMRSGETTLLRHFIDVMTDIGLIDGDLGCEYDEMGAIRDLVLIERNRKERPSNIRILNHQELPGLKAVS